MLLHVLTFVLLSQVLVWLDYIVVVFYVHKTCTHVLQYCLTAPSPYIETLFLGTPTVALYTQYMYIAEYNIVTHT